MMRPFTALIALIALAALWAAMPAVAADPPPVLGRDALIARIRAESVAVEAAEADYARRRDAATMAPTEAIDYADYVERLREKVARDCSDLAQYWAEPVPSTLPCAQAAVAAQPQPAHIDTRTERTDTERTDELDAELNESLGRFDDLLRREQERVRAERPIEAGGSASGGGGDGGDGAAGGDGDDSGDGSGDDNSDSSADSGDKAGNANNANANNGAESTGGLGKGGDRSGARKPTAGRPTGGTQPKDVGDGNDDDIVARQLREAAEKETDPALKEKLWDEYRKYKKGTG